MTHRKLDGTMAFILDCLGILKMSKIDSVLLGESKKPQTEYGGLVSFKKCRIASVFSFKLEESKTD